MIIIDFDDEGKIAREYCSHCLRCGRRLKDEESQNRGYGAVCWKKRHQNSQQTLFDKAIVNNL